MEKKVTILSIDGGGIRGIIPAMILDYIERELRDKTGNSKAILSDYFDLVAGTSTGGILACYYLHPNRFPASDAIDIYEKRGKEIFKNKFLRFGFAKEKYPAIGLEKVLKEIMGDYTLAQSLKNCMITAYDVTKRKAVLFTSPEAREPDSKKNYLLREVARATSAAPTYFEIAALNPYNSIEEHMIDGAMYANNPVMCAVVEANKTDYEFCPNPSFKDLFVVSVGTGKDKKEIDYKKAKGWGAIGWVQPVIGILLSASAEVVHYQMKQVFEVAGFPKSYVRLEPKLTDAKFDMDDASKENINRLKKDADRFIKGEIIDYDDDDDDDDRPKTTKEQMDKMIDRLIEIKGHI